MTKRNRNESSRSNLQPERLKLIMIPKRKETIAGDIYFYFFFPRLPITRLFYR
jgi:hypothetical protein